ncbi:hypothetical protein DL546_009755 [Coniochaeta pulveracea]|nr:hypothetical protein DL546_009755 [Coniochaeta pulveracea]
MADFHGSRTAQRQQNRTDTVSPPSSPEPDYTTRRAAESQQANREVSPLDAEGWGKPLARGPLGHASQVSVDSQQLGNNSQTRSNIPMMRRQRRKQSDAALRERQSQERLEPNKPGNRNLEVRYDAMTGEMTTSTAGRPPAVKPAAYAHGLGITSASPSPTRQRSPSAVMTSFGNRVRQMAQGGRKSEGPEKGTTDPASRAFSASASRPGWKGASGRTALVEPVRDTLEVAPLRIPTKNNTHMISPSSTASLTSQNLPLSRSARGETPPVSPYGAETGPGARPRETLRKDVPSQVTSPTEHSPVSRGPRPPSPPLSDPVNETDAPLVPAKHLQPSENALNIQVARPDNQKSVQLEASHTHANHAHQKSVSSAYSQLSHVVEPHPQSSNQNSLAPSDPWVQPPSRFSITTYATSAANTPRESFDDFDHNRPPVPATPLQYRNSPQTNQSSMVTSNQVPSAGSENIPPSTDSSITQDQSQSPPGPPPSSAALQRKAAALGTIPYRLASSRLSIASDMNKSLPPPPPESSARDRISKINAQLTSLGNRRINITRSIKQMTELMPTDSILNSQEVVTKREMEKKIVERLRAELAEVQREEYDLGLKLHRAYKRMDREVGVERTTALWVRRVTG